MKAIKRRGFQILMLLFVGIGVTSAEEADTPWDWGKWDLDVLTFPRTCEAVLVGRLVPIELSGEVNNNRNYYLIIADEVLFGRFEKCCVLEVPEGGIDNRNEEAEKQLEKIYRDAGTELSEGSWARSFARRPYLLFLRRKENHWGLPQTFEGLCTYGLVDGLNGIVGMRPSCTEMRSRLEIERQYGIPMDSYAITALGDREINEHAHDFLDAIKFYLAEKKRSRGELVKDEIVLSEASKAIYDALVLDKPMPPTPPKSSGEVEAKYQDSR